MTWEDERIHAWEAVAEHPTLRPAYDVDGALLPAVLARLTDLGDLEHRRRQVKARRWWQRPCPYRWYDLKEDGETNYWHEHYCRLEGSGEPHTHTCDCGSMYRQPTYSDTAGCQPIKEDDASGDWGYLCRRSDLLPDSG